MKSLKNIIVPGVGDKPIALDVLYTENNYCKPVIIYAHGFNGFKDWGNFDLVATQFANADFVFVKFNFSHNGTSPQHPEEFVNLDAYANNNYTKELDDLSKVIDWTLNTYELTSQIDANKVYLLGHSMGGGIALIKAAEDNRIKKVATWASISECKTPWGSWPKEKLRLWKETGVMHITNSRTKQQMPLHYQLFEDYNNHQSRLNIERAIASLQIPVLLCHGTNDEAVPFAAAQRLKVCQPSAELFIVESDHVFGRKHPWLSSELPDAMQAVLNKTMEFYLQ